MPDYVCRAETGDLGSLRGRSRTARHLILSGRSNRTAGRSARQSAQVGILRIDFGLI